MALPTPADADGIRGESAVLHAKPPGLQGPSGHGALDRAQEGEEAPALLLRCRIGHLIVAPLAGRAPVGASRAPVKHVQLRPRPGG
eukprot:9476802-Lingulodinium_polyedra.AAC.1